MVEEQIIATERGVKDSRVIEALLRVPRHCFVTESQQKYAYEDRPLSIGAGQTISQPFMVAFMTEILALEGEERVLEIGTGCGYQSAVLAEVAKDIYSIEVIDSLSQKAKSTLSLLGYNNIHLKVGDGYGGWPEEAPFDAILVACAPVQVPEKLIEQLKPGGRMIVPVGEQVFGQELLYITKNLAGKVQRKKVMSVRFVPMIKGE